MAIGRASLARYVLLCGLSLSIGWGIRGNFGHSHGAMIPGALAAIAAAIIAGREDWWRRAGMFGMFGAIGWAFGGRMSYMQVIAYTHSGHWPSQLYGYACLCVIGFLWAALGGAWTALPACLDRARLTSLFSPTLTVLAAWLLKNLLLPFFFAPLPPDRRHESPLYWHDTSWVDALVALAALLGFALFELTVRRRRPRWGTRFLLYMACGWWAAFLLVIVVLVDGLGVNFRMTPPRGDDWVGTLGMTAGTLLFLIRNDMRPAVRAALIAGLFGGAGFAAATFLKLVEVRYVPLVPLYFFGESDWQTNWHSVLEQTYGLFNGIGIGVAMYGLAGEVAPVEDEPRTERWTEVVAVSFTLMLITYVNLATDVPNWIEHHAIPSRMYRLPSRVWFNALYAILAASVIWLLARHIRRPLAVVPTSGLGQSQLLYLVLLWWVVVGNLMHAIPPFAEQRLITEGVIHLNAVICTVLVLVWPERVTALAPDVKIRRKQSLPALAGVGLAALACVTLIAFCGTRAIYGDQFAGQANLHVRFGPKALPPLPKKGEKHP
jgi:hypothetical protein